MKQRYLILLLLFTAAFTFSGEVEFTYPAYFPKPVYDFKRNPLTQTKIALGRQLFYDPVLSGDSSISCASCHSPFNAFAHTDHSLSHGIHDSIGTRNAPPLFNLAWHKQFMWDGAVNHLDMQALAPITHPAEMAEKLDHVIGKLRNSGKYPELFYKAFGDTAITGERMLKSLSQFEVSLVSAGSKYDLVKQGKAEFTPEEQQGYQLFRKNCNACHAEPLFTNFRFESNGLPVDPYLRDAGRAKITHQPGDSLRFKVPTLRNIVLTPPYMHDGRFKKLAQVLNFYVMGIVPHETLGKPLRKGIYFSNEEKIQLLAFLNALTDKSFTTLPANLSPDFPVQPASR